MLSFFIILLTLFLLSYLFIPRAMWKYYVSDTTQFGILGAVYLLIAIPWFLLSPVPPWGFLVGFWLFDPWSYRMIAWPRIQAGLALQKRINDQLAKCHKASDKGS